MSNQEKPTEIERLTAQIEERMAAHGVAAALAMAIIDMRHYIFADQAVQNTTLTSTIRAMAAADVAKLYAESGDRAVTSG